MATTKKCSKCAEVKGVECFSKDRGAKDGLFRWCKACACAYTKAYAAVHRYTEKFQETKRRCESSPKARARQKAYREAHHERVLEVTREWRRNGGVKEKLAAVEEKQCRMCGEIKLAGEFTPRKDSKDGLDSWCKACVAARMRQYAAANPEVRARCDAWQKSPRRKEWWAEYRHTGSCKAARARYAASDKGKASRMRRNVLRRAREENILCTLTGWQWRAILKAQGHACYYCHRPFGPDLKATQDHKVPIARGGDHTRDNVLAACTHCNCSKRDGDWPVTMPSGSPFIVTAKPDEPAEETLG